MNFAWSFKTGLLLGSAPDCFYTLTRLCSCIKTIVKDVSSSSVPGASHLEATDARNDLYCSRSFVQTNAPLNVNPSLRENENFILSVTFNRAKIKFWKKQGIDANEPMKWNNFIYVITIETRFSRQTMLWGTWWRTGWVDDSTGGSWVPLPL